MQSVWVIRYTLLNPTEITPLGEGLQSMHYRLHLRFCLIYGHRLPCCPLCYSLLCRNHGWPIRCDTAIPLLVDQGGIEPPSRTFFSSLHTAIFTLTMPSQKYIPNNCRQQSNVSSNAPYNIQVKQILCCSLYN